jgi:hypothetical protein
MSERSTEIPDGKWCVFHPDGPLDETASDDALRPVIIVCEALGANWDDLKEAGFYLSKLPSPTEE